jgi:hypothetical protein
MNRESGSRATAVVLMGVLTLHPATALAAKQRAVTST